MQWKTRLTDMLGIVYPIIQGGLAHLAYADLAAAVSNAGGLGQITAMSLNNSDSLRNEINKVRKLTSRPFGVNFAIGQYNKSYTDMVETALEEKVSVITVTGGNPKPVFDLTEGCDVKRIVLVASARQAQKAEQLGADAVIVVGQEGGGHIGKTDTGTMVLTPKVIDTVSIPVVASGGIGDGRGMMAALSLGADAVEMGTRFIATEECIAAHSVYKQKLIEAEENDTVVIKRSLGSPGRVLRNKWTENIIELEKNNPGFEVLKSYISGKANLNYIYEGIEEEGFGWAGQISSRITDIPTVDQLFHRIIAEAEQVRKKWGN